MAISTIGASGLNSAVSQIGKNILHNGAMTVAQRGTSEAAVFGSASGYGAWPDGFRSERASGSEGGRATFSQDSSGPVGFANCFKVLETTTDSSPGSGDLYRVVTRIEAQDLQHLAYGNAAAKTTTLSFYVFCNLTGAFTVTVGQSDTTRTYSTTYTVDSANTWERKTITIPGDASGVINDDTGIGFEIGFPLGTGSAFKGGTQGSWAANNNNMLGAGMTNNVLGSSAGDWRLTGLQLEVGSVATDFEHEDIGETKRKCQRYFLLIDGTTANWHAGYQNLTSRFYVPISLGVEMRAAPTATSSAAATFALNLTGGAVSGSTVDAGGLGPTTTVGGVVLTHATAGTAGNGGMLSLGSASTYIHYSADL